MTETSFGRSYPLLGVVFARSKCQKCQEFNSTGFKRGKLANCWLRFTGFTEGFDTLDLKEAKGLLEQL